MREPEAGNKIKSGEFDSTVGVGVNRGMGGAHMEKKKEKNNTLRLHRMSWGVKLPPVLRPQKLSLGGSGVSIGGVRSLRVGSFGLEIFIFFR